MPAKLCAAEFDRYIEARLKEIKEISYDKGLEYAKKNSRMENFHQGGALCRCSPERYLLTLVAKHEVALRDFVERLEGGRETPAFQWQEKTGDIIIYMLLLEGLLCERGVLKKGHLEKAPISLPIVRDNPLESD